MPKSLLGTIFALILFLLMSVSCSQLGQKINGAECDNRNPSSDQHESCSPAQKELPSEHLRK